VRLLALLEDAEGPSARLRLEPFARRLEAQGHAVERVALPGSGPRRWRELAAARAFDAALVQRRLLLPWESALLRARARRLVVDVDDAIWRRDHPPFESWSRRVRAGALLRRADAVLAGSRTLAGELSVFGVRAFHLPTPAPPQPPAAPGDRAPAEAGALVWIGQRATFRYLRDLGPAWARIRAARPRVRLIVVGSGLAGDEAFPGAEFRDWSLAAEREALAEATIGLAPLPDDPWTRGKCGARLLTCLASGLTAVASPVGAQRELAEEVGGVIAARSAEEFASAALSLLADREGTVRTGAGARARLQALRGIDALWDGWAAQVAGSRGSGLVGARVAAPPAAG